MKILCIGQSSYDITLPVTSYPVENKKIKINQCKVECGGGSANNAAYLLALWGSEVLFLSSIGKDYYGRKIKEELQDIGININYLNEIDGETTTSYIIANINSGTRTIITNKNMDMHYNEEVALNEDYDVIYSDGNDYELALNLIKKNDKAISILDAGNVKEGTLALCKCVDYVVCSNDFAKEFTKIDFNYDDIETIKKVHQIMVEAFNTKVIITLEAKGCFTEIDGEYKLIPSIKVKAVDSTGAGDIFHGAFTYFITKGYALVDALRLANITGALSVRNIGSKPSMPKLSEVMSYYEL